MEGTGEPVRVRTVLATIKGSWFSSEKRAIDTEREYSWFSVS